MRTGLPRVVGVVLLTCIVGGAGCSQGAVTYLSPDARREVVIERGRASIDTVWIVSVRDARRFTGSESIGCFTDDDPESPAPTHAVWSDADAFVIGTTADDAAVRVHLGPDGHWSVDRTAEGFLVPCPYG